MATIVTIALALFVAFGGMAVAAQNGVEVPWGNETIVVDPGECALPYQALVTDRVTYERLGEHDRTEIEVVILVEIEDGWAISATPPPVEVMGEYDQPPGAVFCFEPQDQS